MSNFVTRIFCKPTPSYCAAVELADARLQLLAAHSAKEYAVSVIDYRNAQISRLTRFLTSEADTSIPKV